MEALLLAAVIAGGAYWYSVWRHPYRRCKRCNGGKGHVDTTLFRGTYGRCHACAGSGQRVRWGVRILTPGAYQAIQAGKKGKNF